MKHAIFSIIILSLSLSKAKTQSYELNYKRGSFTNEKGEKAHWEDAFHLFDYDDHLLDRYEKYRLSRKTANSLGIACLAQAAGGLILIWGFNSSCDNIICSEQAIGIVLFVVTAPLTGLIGIIVAASASGRKSKLIYDYNRQGLSSIKGLDSDTPYLKIHPSGLGLGISYHF